jgi:cytosine/adenosine deaminase-related metal-dependent hydrolase
MQRAAAIARKRKLRVVTHVAESAAEFEMFKRARGEMFAWLRRNQRDMSDCGGVSPVQHLARHHALGPHLLAVHVNYLAPGDARLLAQRKVNVVHCPRSHAYFRHRDFLRQTLAGAGVNVCLGTDSLATVVMKKRQPVELNMFAEMRAYAATHGGVPPELILCMATVNGAQALGWQGKVGELSRGAFADLIVLPFAGKTTEVYEAALNHSGNVAASMIGGRWEIARTE